MSYVYWESQFSDELCAVHAINSLLQGPYWDAGSLSEIALAIDRQERELYGGNSQSSNVSISGNYSIQVISACLEHHELTCENILSEEGRKCFKNLTNESGFIVNGHEHWFSIRKVAGKWFNLNSLNPYPGPVFISDFYLEALIHDITQQGQTVFVIQGQFQNASQQQDDQLQSNQFCIPIQNLLPQQEQKKELTPEEQYALMIEESKLQYEQQEQALMKQILEESMKTQPIPQLDPEPTDPRAFEMRMRLPNGQFCTRKFLPSDTLQKVLNWGLVQTEGLDIKLVTTFPRRILVEFDKSLQELSFGPMDNTVIVEKNSLQLFYIQQICLESLDANLIIRDLYIFPSQKSTEALDAIYEDGNWETFNNQSFDEKWETSFSLTHPGAYEFYAELDGQRGNKNLIVVDPLIQLKGQTIYLPQVCIQTVLPRCLGKIDQWLEKLNKSAELNYNFIHFPPLQELGMSGSFYCINNYSRWNSELFDAATEEMKLEQVVDLVNKLEQLGCGSVIDIVLNHCACSSDFIQENPDFGYTLINSPYLNVAWELDQALLRFSADLAEEEVGQYTKGALVENEEDVDLLIQIFSQKYLKKLRLEEFFLFNIDEQDKIYTGLKLKPFAGKFIHELDQKRLQDFTKLCVIGEGESRFGCSLNFEELYQFVREEQIGTQGIVHQIYEAQIEKYKLIEVEILQNIKNFIMRYKVQEKERVITAKRPLIRTYFSRVQDTYGLNNGFIWGNDDVTKDIACKEDWNYLRRSIDIWGDCFKLRYGVQYEDNPPLWEKMTEYVTQMAQIFHGIRLDNAHGTPLTVSSYLLDKARQVKPNLLIIAELFTNTQEQDTFYLQSLGVSLVVREAIHGYQDTIAGTTYMAGTEKMIGSHIDLSLKGEQLFKPISYWKIYYDQTHDNESYKDIHTISHQLSICGFAAFSTGAVGSVWGFDTLYPKKLSVVWERRIYNDEIRQKEYEQYHQSPVLLYTEGVSAFIEWMNIYEDKPQIFVHGEWNNWGEGVELQEILPGLYGVEIVFEKHQIGQKLQLKYRVNDNWQTNPDFEQIDDGEGNINNQIIIGQKNLVYESTQNLQEAKKVCNKIHQQLVAEGFTELNIDRVTSNVYKLTRFNPDTLESYVLVTRTGFKDNFLDFEQFCIQLEGHFEEVTAQFTISSAQLDEIESDQFVNGNIATVCNFRNLDKFAFIQQNTFSDDLQFNYIPPGFIGIYKVVPDKKVLQLLQEVQKIKKEIQSERFSKILSSITSAQFEKLFWGNDTLYEVPCHGQLQYAGLGGIIQFLKQEAENNSLDHAIWNHMRAGNWLLEYYSERIQQISPQFERIVLGLDKIGQLPNNLKLREFTHLILLLAQASNYEERIPQESSEEEEPEIEDVQLVSTFYE